jgi:hypothetical protein
MIVVCFGIQVAHPAGKPPMIGRILVRIVDVPLRLPISENDRYRPCRPKKPKPHTFSFVFACWRVDFYERASCQRRASREFLK